MSNIFDDIKKAGAKIVDTTAKTATDIAKKGKDKATVISLENELAKAQRQLGAYVYTSRKTGIEDHDQMMQYIGRIADIEIQLNGYKVEDITKVEITPICPSCGAEVKEDAVFCEKCGAKVSSTLNEE